MPDLAEIKAAARLALHGAMAVPATYTGPQDDALPRPVTVRWHNKLAPALSIEQGGAGVVTGVERLIFSSVELAKPSDGGDPIELERNGHVLIPGENLDVVLDNEGNPDGPQNVYWSVTSSAGS